MLSRFAATSAPEPPPLAAEYVLRWLQEKAGLEDIKRVIVGCRQELHGDSDENSTCQSEDTSGSRNQPTGSSPTKRGKRKAPVKKAAFKSLPAQRKKLSAAAPRKNLRTPATSCKAVPSTVADLQGRLRSTSDGQTRSHAPPILLRSDPGTSQDRPSTSAESSSSVPRWPASSPSQTSSL
ncbi:hypothetical protein XELAEV_18037153mg, partial [Xenopus laevis]